MSAVTVRRLAAAFRLAAIADRDTARHRERVLRWHQLRTPAPALVRLGAWVSCWDLDKTDRARVHGVLDALVAQGRVTR